MSNDRYVIGLDFGTLSCRCVLINVSGGELVASAEKYYSHGIMRDFLPDNGTPLGAEWCLQNPNDYLDVLLDTVNEVSLKVPREQIVALSIDFTASTLLPLDKSGNPLCNDARFSNRPHAYVKLWKHHAAQAQANEINDKLEQFPNEVSRHYGERISSEIVLPKALQILREDPEIYHVMDTLSEAGDWLNRLLTGKQKRSISTAGYKAMYFNNLGFPPPDFFKRIDPHLGDFVQSKLRGEICQITEPFGFLSKSWARKLNLHEGIAVGCSIIDAHAGVVGTGITRPGQMMLTLGTSSVQAVLSTKPYSSKGVVGAIRDAVVPGYFLWESGLAAVGDQLAWFADKVYCGKNSNAIEELTGEAARLDAGECGLIALDWLNGNKTPYVNAELSGMFVGLRLDTTAAEIFRALIESIAFGTRTIMDTFETAGEKVEKIIACGGIVDKNPLMMQIIADVLGREIHLAGSGQTMALGAAIYAAVAAGKEVGGYDLLDEAAARMIQLKQHTYRPNLSQHAIYEDLYRAYLRLSNRFGRSEPDILRNLGIIKARAKK